MNPISRIAAMLKDESPHKRVAAAVVLGELKAKDAEAVNGLCEMAKDPVEAYASHAVHALGEIGHAKALPILLEALGRGGELQKEAATALAAFGEGALPAIKKHLDDATPEVRAALAAVLPSLGGKQSFELALEGLRGQSWDAANRIVLSIRQELKNASDAEKKSKRSQLEKFIDLKRVQSDEAALRGALKLLGFLETPDAAETLLAHLSSRQPAAVRIEAVTALRFAFSEGASRKALRKLMELLEDKDPLISRAARETLTVLNIGPELAEDLAGAAASQDPEVAFWGIARLGAMGGKVAEKTLVPVASGKDRARAQAAAKAIASLPDGEKLLAAALVDAEEEVGAQVLEEALQPLSRKLGKKELGALLKAGAASLKKQVAVARRQLEPVRAADPETWASTLREAAGGLLKKDTARAEAIYGVLARSPLAQPEDRYALARLALSRSSKDPHPRARQRDPALAEFQKLAMEGFPVAKTVLEDKAISDEDRYYLGFHFAEQRTAEEQSLGYELLETIAEKGKKTKLGKAAKNKLALLEG